MRAVDKGAKAKSFRPEIEGLRAVASILVATFHIWLGRVSGGVDVFFVVSSFLITSGLLNQVERDGTIDFTAFWARLVRRLVPAALFVLCVTVLASILLLPQSSWQTTMAQVLAAALYCENWLLAHNSVDYLAQHQAVSPVQHFWALSIQGQFYAVWPFVVAAAAFAARKWQFDLRRVLLAMLASLFALSLAYSVHLTAHNQPYAYFNTFARGWEFCVGAMLAAALPYLRLPTAVRVAASWVGLLAILSCGLVLHVSTVFPGYAALWPTLAGVLIISAGTTGSRFGADRLLTSRPLVALGGISYGIYLWHFPLLVFCRNYFEPQQLPAVVGVAILLGSTALAYLTSRLLENPVRFSSRVGQSHAYAFGIGAASLACASLAVFTWSLELAHVKRQALRNIAGLNEAYPGAQILTAGATRIVLPHVDQIFPGPLAVEHDRDFLSTRQCIHATQVVERLDCPMGDSNAKFTIALVGGSHSSQWLPGLSDIAKVSAWRIYSFTKNNCPFYSGESVGEKKIASCSSWNQQVLSELITLHPDFVFTTSTRYLDDNMGEVVPNGYLAMWRELERHGIAVIAIRDNPDFEFDVSACVELHGLNAEACRLDRHNAIADPSPVDRIASRPSNVRFIDLTDGFCDKTLCRPVVGNILVYRHINHVTASYVHTLAPRLGSEIERVLGFQPLPQFLYAVQQAARSAQDIDVFQLDDDGRASQGLSN